MAFAFAGDLITQSGTDTSLAGIEAIAGVTAVTYGNTVQYRVDDNIRINITGTLTIDPYRETLLMLDNADSGSGGQATFTISSGTLNLGTVATNGVFPEGIPAIIFGGTPNPWWSGAAGVGNFTGSTFVLQTGGTLNWNGGAIMGRATYSFQGTSNINNNATIITLDDGQADGMQYMQRYLSTDLTIGRLNAVGGSISLGNGFEGSRISISRLNSGVGFWPQYVGLTTLPEDERDAIKRTPVTVFDADTRGNVVDYAVYDRTILNIENPLQGSAVTIRGGENLANTSAHANNNGHDIVYRTITSDITNLAGDNVVGYFRLEDYNNSNRKNLSIAGANINDTGDFIYDFPVNGTLGTNNVTQVATSSHQFLPNNAIVSAIVSVAGSNPAGTNNAGPYIKDLRGYTTLNPNGTVLTSVEGEQSIRGYLWSYAETPSVIDVDLDDGTIGDIEVQRIITPDAAITQNLTDITANWTTGDVTFDTTANITTGTAMTTDELYDFVKYRKIEDLALRSRPSLSTMAVELGNTTTINAGTRTITLGGDFSGTTNKGTVQAASLDCGNFDLTDITYSGTISNTADFLRSNITTTSSIEIASTDRIEDTALSLTTITEATSNTFVSGNTYTANTGTAVSISFTGLTAPSYTPEDLLGSDFTITPGDTVNLISDEDITVFTTRTDITGGAGVDIAVQPATVDFSALIAAESNFFSATPTTARAYWALTSDYDGTADQIATGELTSGVYTIPGLTVGQEVAVAVSKPGRENFRQVFTFSGGEVITPVLPSIAAVNESTDITGVVVNGGREAGGLLIFGLSGATTANALDGPQTVWMTELMKGKARYCVGLLEGLAMDITHTSLVSSQWDETVFVMEPITTNQQVLGISSINENGNNPVQDNGTLSIFINGSTEVNYSTIDDLFDANLSPITGELTTIINHVNEVEGNQEIITTNQGVLLTATQRGAVKAAAYSAGNITPAVNTN